jgi:hypothetical protein
LFLFFEHYLEAQTAFSRRLDISHKAAYATYLLLKNDTFFIPCAVLENRVAGIFSTCLMPVKTDGLIISQNRYNHGNESLEPGGNLLSVNGRFYLSGTGSSGTDLQESLFTFNEQCDSLNVKLNGDTSYSWGGVDIKWNLLDRKKLIIFGATDSTCGT